ncbi:hypothetical protein [Paraclostridium bifermentans]|uniref:hypothetical protein n=1 Tax=Paraclostridium bifermentans TaxID=1490 RepID=UPI00189B4788|nr:hypothetical protein [Paraclostridium bifermentans]
MKNISKNLKLKLGIIGFILVDLYLIISSENNSRIALCLISLFIFIRIIFASKNKCN